MTALVGPNNTGKSALKLFFYEMRDLFLVFLRDPHNQPNLISAAAGSSVGVNYLGVSDVQEIFNNTNGRNLTFEIEVIGATSPAGTNRTINKMVATCSRSAPTEWSIQFFSVEEPRTAISEPNGFQPTGTVRQFIGGSSLNYNADDLVDVMRAFHGARYYGAFRNALNQGSGQHYDFNIGTAFIDLWNTWKTSGNKAQSRAIGKITDEIRTLFEFDHLEINASVLLKTLLVTINGHQYRLAELGSGISQFIMALGNAATTTPPLILIDEPETNLHPSLQIDFLLKLAQYATAGCLFSTHSVGLARSVAERIYTVQKDGRGPTVRPFETTATYSEFLGELSFSTFRDMGCDRILLVEGVTDVKVIQQFLRLVQKEHTTVILPLGGDQMVTGSREMELQELRRLSQNIVALVDSERTIDGAQPAERRLKFAEVCRRVGFDVCLTEKRAIENYFPDYAVKAALGSSFAALAPYELLSEHANGWSKSDNWRIAHHVTKHDLLTTDIGQFLSRI
ncbi:AAA family ATPase [Bradyrhizobium sp. 2]|uniref:AAA family ATPase n=1 Tax=Bradyrhizobium sp. 2 TaxID=190045 RepID=UPI001FFAF9DA|nr:AAA family ATPase [Bradyrhizobium sp. 2]MCK1463329.1 AAA family ATPase [Bradyrhizobium sp. 2]